AIAAVGGATFLGFPIGPVLGGWLLDHFWWGSVFLINVPVVVIALVAVTLLMPESRSNQRPRMDIVGVVISSAGLIALTYGAIKAGQNGWSDTTAVTMMAGGVVLLAAFAAWERAVGRRPAGPRRRPSRWSISHCSARRVSPGARSWPRWCHSRFSGLFSRCRSISSTS